MDQLTASLLRCFEAAFPDIPPSDALSLQAADCPAWDSVAMVVLVNLVQDELGVEIPPEDVAKLLSFASFREYLGRTAGS